MASASSTSAKNLFVDSKRRLGERVQVNVNNMASICRQVLRGSQSADMLSKAARNMALQDNALENTTNHIHKMQLLVTHLSYQQEAIERSASTLPEIREQVKLGWQGGAEALFGNVRERDVELDIDPACKQWTLRQLLVWLKNDSGYLTGNSELFFSGETIRNGVMVLVNDTDWELLGELEYELQENDHVIFISTLHGG